MIRLSRSGAAVLAAIAAAATAATTGCAEQASMASSPVVLTTPVVLATLGSQNAHSARPHPTPGKKSPHNLSPSPARTTPTSRSTTADQQPASSTSTSAPQPGTCTTSATNGECGPYTDPQIEGLGSGNQDKIQVGNNMWNAIAGASSTLYAKSPGDWYVTANMPTGNTAVVSYPSVGADFHLQNSSGNWYEQPLTNFGSMVSSFSENMHANGGTSAWAAYDIWLNGGKNEVMIQHDFANNGACTAAATATFGGSNGVPVQNWHLCQFGSELVWKLGTNDNSKINEQSGSVDILAMLKWLENHGYVAKSSTIGLLGYGWEIASTAGRNENFQVSSFSITASRS